MPTGIIVKGIGGFYYIKTEDEIYECKARGVFRKDNMAPLPGDIVSISTGNDGKTGSIDEIFPRKTELIRPAVANVDQIVVVTAVKSPSPDYILLDKLLVTAELKGIIPAVCINKVDLDQESDCEKISSAYRKAGYPVIMTSSKTGEGYEELKALLESHITVFAGQSGVGKSTILNTLMNSKVMPTGEVSNKIERGKHTTRHAELVELEGGGYIVDTPGFSSFELVEIMYNELELYYPEFLQYINKCKYTGCSHIAEPGCLVKQALENGLIDAGRYERYIQLYGILKENKPFKWKQK